MRLLFTVLPLLLLPACAPIAAVLSYGHPTVQAAAQLDQSKLVADGVVLANSGKTVTDHAVSLAMGSDCRLINALAGDPICTSICR